MANVSSRLVSYLFLLKIQLTNLIPWNDLDMAFVKVKTFLNQLVDETSEQAKSTRTAVLPLTLSEPLKK
jgi:hypothetical protein